MKIEKIESYPSLTTDEQETVLTWDANELLGCMIKKQEKQG